MMARAMVLAARGRFTTMPNPCVGCVLTRQGEVVGEGWHRRAGEPHAEVNALLAAGEKAQGATAYITLEPCSHHGRTPPCAQALIDAGVSRVVYAMQDPNPQVSGQGLEMLETAGIVVDGPLLQPQAEKLNRGFIKRQRQGLPWVTVKLAMSLDGRTAMASGESQWITGPAARSDVQRLRAGSCAVVTGIGSVLIDDPAMTVRADELGQEDAQCIELRQPLRVIVDSQMRTPPSAKMLAGDKVLGDRVLIATAQPAGNREGAETLSMPNGNGQVDLTALLRELAARECNQVLIEAGATLAGAFLQLGLIDELVVYVAPTLLGSDARPLLDLPLQAMAEKVPLKIIDVRAVGSDWRITAVPQTG